MINWISVHWNILSIRMVLEEHIYTKWKNKWNTLDSEKGVASISFGFFGSHFVHVFLEEIVLKHILQHSNIQKISNILQVWNCKLIDNKMYSFFFYPKYMYGEAFKTFSEAMALFGSLQTHPLLHWCPSTVYCLPPISLLALPDLWPFLLSCSPLPLLCPSSFFLFSSLPSPSSPCFLLWPPFLVYLSFIDYVDDQKILRTDYRCLT